MTKRIADHPIDPIFLERWSPRAFIANTMPASDLSTILEAARWAPSAYNIQPWRFLYAHRNDAHWQQYLDLLDPFNVEWAQHASSLVFVLSDTIAPGHNDQPETISRSHSFDAGAAWAQLALQASSLGYHAHAMAGIYFDKSQTSLNIPERYRIEVAVAIGRRNDPSSLPAGLQGLEQTSERVGLQEIAFAGTFPQ